MITSKSHNLEESSVTLITLFTTTGTLVCCALPIALVTLGMGATMASLVSAVPFLMTLGQYKIAVFGVSGLLIGFSAFLMYRPGRYCPADPKLAEICNRTQRWNRRVVWFSGTLWSIGFFAAYLSLPLITWLEK